MCIADLFFALTSPRVILVFTEQKKRWNNIERFAELNAVHNLSRVNMGYLFWMDFSINVSNPPKPCFLHESYHFKPFETHI